MNRTLLPVFLTAFFLIVSASFAQVQLDPKPLDLVNDPDIDLFIGCWQNSIPFNTHGNLTERAILTPCTGDELKPVRKGAVLTAAKRFSRANLDPHVSTTPTTLKGEQEIYYIESGKGILTAGKQSIELREGIFIIVPEGLESTMTNTGDDMLFLYLICEPAPAGFTPKKEIVVKDEKAMALRDQGYLKVHWSHNGKNVFVPSDGLATLLSVNYITFDPMTIGQPHSHGPKLEEVWTVISGKNLAFLGKEIRWQTPGMAYKIPPTGTTPHSNINPTGEPCRFLYFSKLK
jgi:mannose-6-phosphate isomerase-like protein (cupin superfamily)